MQVRKIKRPGYQPHVYIIHTISISDIGYLLPSKNMWFHRDLMSQRNVRSFLLVSVIILILFGNKDTQIQECWHLFGRLSNISLSDETSCKPTVGDLANFQIHYYCASMHCNTLWTVRFSRISSKILTFCSLQHFSHWQSGWHRFPSTPGGGRSSSSLMKLLVFLPVLSMFEGCEGSPSLERTWRWKLKRRK